MVRIAMLESELSQAELNLLAARFGNTEFLRLDQAAVQQLAQNAFSAGTPGSDFAAVHVNQIADADSLCLQAADAGKHLLVETGQLTRAGLGPVEDACRAANTCLMLSNCYRYAPAIRCVKECLEAGKLGETGLLRIHRWTPRNSSRGTGARRWIADIDLACWLIGTMPTHVYATQGQTADDAESSDYIQLHLGFPGNAMALLDDCCHLPDGDGYFSLSVIGSRGASYADDHHDMQLVYHGGNPSARHQSQRMDTAEAQLRGFLEAIAVQQPTAAAASCTRDILRVADAANESLKQRQPVRLDSQRDYQA